MSTADTIDLAVSIALGVVSIGLAAFAIWLSLRFNDQSRETLDAMKNLVTEIRSLINATLDQQKSFSSKMLDSILAKDAFGQPAAQPVETSALASILKEELRETEQRIAEQVDIKVRALPRSGDADQESIARNLNSLRQEIAVIAKRAATRLDRTALPSALREVLKEWAAFPAFYVVLAGIIKEQAYSVDAIRNIEKVYNIPPGWEEALETLRSKHIIKGPDSGFAVNSDYITPLAAWIDSNWNVIRKLIAFYGTSMKAGPVPEETALAAQMSF